MPPRGVSGQDTAAFTLQRAYRRSRYRRVFQKMVAALRAAETASPDELLSLLAPGEAALARDPLCGVNVRLRFVGEDGEFPPRLVFKLYRSGVASSSSYLSGAPHFHASLGAEVQAAKQMGQRQNLRVHRHYLCKVHVPLVAPQHDRRGHLRRLDEVDRRPVSLGGRGNDWRPVGVTSSSQKWTGACAIDTIPVKGLRMPHHDAHWHSAHRHTVKPAQHHVEERTHAPGLHAVHAFTQHMGNTRRSTRPPGVADTRGQTANRPLPYSSRSAPAVVAGADDGDADLHVYKGDGNYHHPHKAWEHEKAGVPRWKVSRIPPHAAPVYSAVEEPRQSLRMLTRRRRQPRPSTSNSAASRRSKPSLLGTSPAGQRPGTSPAGKLRAPRRRLPQRSTPSLIESRPGTAPASIAAGAALPLPHAARLPADGAALSGSSRSRRQHKPFEWRVDGDHHALDFENAWPRW